ncbi:MAG: hypothetical protein MR873_12635 [Parabacteroides sp.]|nr:hypothetical protein [Parabacteroides sp.]MDD7721532.1 hypothetical protein [bacterium]MDY4844839.1 hypothetical protein [Parabacteroides sp.]
MTIKKAMLLVGVFCTIHATNVVAVPSYSQDKQKEEIPPVGEWGEGERSCPSDRISLMIFWDGTYLYIESTTGRSEIQVSLSNGFQATIPAGTTSTAIYVGELNGPCELELTNQFGDRLVGVIE